MAPVGTVTEVGKISTVGMALTATLADPDFEVSCVEVAITVAVPVAAGVNTPPLLTVPMVEGLTDQVTVVL